MILQNVRLLFDDRDFFIGRILNFAIITFYLKHFSYMLVI